MNSVMNDGMKPVARNSPRDLAALAGRAVELEDGLEVDDAVVVHADDLGDRGDLARAVDEALLLHDEVDRVGDLLADGARRQVDAAHEHQRLEARDRLVRASWRGSW